VCGCTARYAAVFADTVLAVVAIPLWLQESGAALATGMTMAADPKASRPPANIPPRPRRTVVGGIVFVGFMEPSLRIAITRIPRPNPRPGRSDMEPLLSSGQGEA